MGISEREFSIIKEIANNHHPSQRAMARKLGISLGLTNILIRRLVKKGLLKARQLNRRKVQYILTPEGFSEKAKKSYDYTLRTIDSLKRLKKGIQQIALREYDKGARDFTIVGRGELGDLVEMSLRDLHLPELTYCRSDEYEGFSSGNKRILLTEGVRNSEKGIDIVSSLADLSTPQAGMIS